MRPDTVSGVQVLCVAGARPNFMKVKPVVDALEARGVSTILVHTGQHYDASMSDVFFEELGLRTPDHHLGVGSGTHAEQTAAVMVGLERLLETVAPDVIVVVGDVNSTLAAALVGAKACIPVAHVEAGLRSRDWSMPEEINRVIADRVSRYLFASSEEAVTNLRAEAYPEDRIFLAGNTMIDTLLANLERARAHGVLDRLGVRPHEYGVVTLHRPSNVDDPGTFQGILKALARIAEEIPLVFPVHPRTAAGLDGITIDGLRTIEPLGYLDFIALLADARLVLTDSGGIQEETTVLGVPCLTLRNNTERPVTVTEGTNRVVGVQPDAIVGEALTVLRDGVSARRPELWDGHAAERIAEALVEGMSAGAGPPR